MVEVFKTNIQKEKEARSIARLLSEHFPDSTIDFDLEDRDKVLRIDTHGNIQENVIELLQTRGYYCEILI